MHTHLTDSLDSFNICVKIIEAKDLPDTNISSLVKIQVGEQKKQTKIIKNTNTPYFNEYFVFEVNSDFENVMSKMITISIFQPRKKLKLKKLIGCIMFDIGIIWYRLNRRLVNWLPLAIPSDNSAQVKGFLKCDVKIEAASVYRKLTTLEETTGDIEQLHSLVGKRVRYRIKIYKCVGLMLQKEEDSPDVSVRVLFAGKTGSSTKRKLLECVEWNEQITFTAMFPPLFHKLTVELVVGKNSVVAKHFYILEVLKYCKSGFQSMFGPNYVHFYKNEVSYCGSLFMAIEIDSSGIFKNSEMLHEVTTLPTEYPSQQTFGLVDNFLCFGLLFDSMLCGRSWKGSKVQLALNFGYSGRNSDETKNHPLTDQFTALAGNSDFSYLPLNEQKPCVFIRSEWPDYTHRLINSNMLSNITQNLRETIDIVEDLMSRGKTLESINIIKNSVNQFKKNCKEVSRMLVKGFNDLDFGRVEFLSKTLSFKLPHLASGCIEEESLESVLQKLIHILNIVEELCNEIQESLPCVVLSLKTNQSVIGSKIVDPRHILHSNQFLKRGCDCGKIISVLIKSPSNKLAGRLDIWLWLGFWDEVSYCLKGLPPGHEDLSKIVYLPTTVTYENIERYIIYCRIHSGYIEDISSYDSRIDPFVRVLCLNQSQQTRAVKQSVAPIWKETLVLSDIRSYTSQTFSQENPPFVTVELWNQAVNPPNLIGVELIRPSHSTTSKSEGQIELQWLKIENKAKMLSVFEIVRLGAETKNPFNLRALSNNDLQSIDPVNLSFRLEVVFWGIRPVEITGFYKNISRAQAIIQCSTCKLKSSVIDHTKTSLNFQHDLQIVQLQLPSIKYFSPPLTLEIMSDNTFVGCTIERNIAFYENHLPTKQEWDALYVPRKSVIDRAELRHTSYQEPISDLTPLLEIDPRSRSMSGKNLGCGLKFTLKNLFDRMKLMFSRTINRIRISNSHVKYKMEEEEFDWWLGYFSGDITFYSDELENQKQFNGFYDVLKTFTIKEQKTTSVKDVLKVKILMSLYKWPTEKSLLSSDGQDPEMGVIRINERRDRVKLLVRVYCIRAHDLHPTDPNGLADPFIEIATPSNSISDKSNYIAKQLDPVFGRCLEITATLPIDSILTIRVMDWDMFTASDLIGETTIDIENRFYSKHRATCGLSKTYSLTGYNSWRDVEKPTDILEKLCQAYNLPPPKYYGKGVLIGSKEFALNKSLKTKDDNEENVALLVLNKWSDMPIVGRSLVPMHVETRSLYVKDKPGLERGKLELWVDLFDQSADHIPPPIDIKPRKPQLYELRVVILNTSQVPLVDDSFFVGKKHTDIFVKGWLWDPSDFQTTDIHYTSINGTGNFNWRFIFQFSYHKQEKRMVIRKKDLFSVGKAESTVPALLSLQVWDSDKMSPDDFIGAMVLELSKMPPGAVSVRTCKSKHFLSPTKTVDLFKVKRLRGWWPFFQMTTDIEPKNAGFLEAEFHLLTKEEALFNPAGLGRSAPNALPPPLRPSVKIKFWLAPYRALTHYIFGVHKGKLILCVSITAIVLFLLVGIYSIPLFIMKRILGA